MTDGVYRMPEFLIIGAMKAGTTSLFRWLESTGAVGFPAVKEPNFFTDHYEKGLDWYGSQFSGLPAGIPVGEASVAYSDPVVAAEVATRIREAIPKVKLIFLARNPTDRLRSHYRHEVQRRRETRRFEQAVTDPEAGYLRRSLYGQALTPYLAEFEPPQLLVIEFSELLSGTGFETVLAHLGLPPRPRPAEDYNITADKRRFTPLARWAFEQRWTSRLARLPKPVRRLAKSLTTRADPAYEAALRQSEDAPLPEPVIQQLLADVSLLEALLGRQFGWILR